VWEHLAMCLKALAPIQSHSIDQPLRLNIPKTPQAQCICTLDPHVATATEYTFRCTALYSTVLYVKSTLSLLFTEMCSASS